jgi:hypothetical protein
MQIGTLSRAANQGALSGLTPGTRVPDLLNCNPDGHFVGFQPPRCLDNYFR